MRYCPRSLVTALRDPCIDGLAAVTVTPGMTAPLVSVTVPVTPPVVSWRPSTVDVNEQTKKTASSTGPTGLRTRSLMTISFPLNAKRLIGPVRRGLDLLCCTRGRVVGNPEGALGTNALLVETESSAG